MRVVLGIPLVGDVPKETFPNHMAVCGEISRFTKEFHLLAPWGLFPHDRARNFIFRVCQDLDADYLMFIDADNTVPVGAFTRLLDVLNKNKAQLVTGHYLRRGFPYTSVWSKKVEGGDISQVDSHEVVEIDACGLGCALIDLRWLFNNLCQPFCLMTPGEEGTGVTDDISLCDKIKAKGGIILGDGTIRCGHLLERNNVTDANAEYLRKLYIEEHSNGFGK